MWSKEKYDYVALFYNCRENSYSSVDEEGKQAVTKQFR